MEREEIINTDFAGESEKEIQFPNLFIAAAILFCVNVVLVLFFYFSPNVLGRGTEAEDTGQYAIAKTSAFEERVRETPFVARAAEKVRPVIEASMMQDPGTQADSSIASYTDTTASAAYQDASYTTNTGDRPVISRSENTDAGQVTASLGPLGARRTEPQ